MRLKVSRAGFGNLMDMYTGVGGAVALLTVTITALKLLTKHRTSTENIEKFVTFATQQLEHLAYREDKSREKINEMLLAQTRTNTLLEEIVRVLDKKPSSM